MTNDRTESKPIITIDGRLTLALLVTVAIEAVMAFLWVGAAAQRLTQLERTAAAQMPVLERIARIEAQVAAVRAALDRIEGRLDRENAR